MGKRLYPDYYPSYAGEPVADRLMVMETVEKGEGLISRVPVKKGELVFIFTGIILSEQTLYTLQVSEGVYLHDPFVMGKVLHSCSPNMSCDMETRSFYATRDIEAGEYLTMDYETTEDVLFRPFECCCGSPHCRGYIQGRSLSSELRKHLAFV